MTILYTDLRPHPALGKPHPEPGYWFGTTNTKTGQRVLTPMQVTWEFKKLKEIKTPLWSSWYVSRSHRTELYPDLDEVIAGRLDADDYNLNCIELVQDNPEALAHIALLLEG